MAAIDIVEQLIAEIQSNKIDINRLQYGEISWVVQDKRVVRLELRQSFKAGADSKNEKPGRNS